MSSKVLSVVYHVLPEREITSRPPETEVASAFRDAVRAGEWLYDPSDDPSFYSARRFAAEGGALSWGALREALGALAPGP